MSTRTVTHRSTGRVETFESILSDERAAALLKGVSGGFAASLVSSYPKWSKSQADWAHKMAMEEYNRKESGKPVATVAFPSLVALFATAGKSLRFPRITFQTSAGTVRIQRAGSQSRYNGDLMVTDGEAFGSNKFYGRIERHDGTWVPGRDASQAVLEVIRAIAANPAEALDRMGKAEGRCCFCGKDLTAEESTTHGYGPVCAKNWGLPHGAHKIVVS
jgi:hypothetical protein